SASESDDLHLVVLDGVNVAPFETYLLPFLVLHGDARIGKVTRPLTFETRDPLTVDLAWPGTVLLAGGCQAGAATLPVPRSAWSDVILLDIESFDSPTSHAELHPDDRDTIVATWPAASVSLAVWDSLKRRSRDQDLAAAAVLWNEAREKFG